MTAKT